jgi:hypothetical protein
MASSIGVFGFLFRTSSPFRGKDHSTAVHRDYWDAAEELYEKLPLLGSLMRWWKRAANN